MRLLPENRELGWTPYVWLVYLGYFCVSPIFDRSAPARTWALTGAAGAVFLVLYFWGFWQKGFRVLRVVAAITALGVLCLPWNPGASVFFVYAASFCGRMPRPRYGLLGIGGVLAVLAAEVLVLHPPFFAWFPAALFSVLVGGVNVHYAEVSRTNARLHATQEEVERLAKTAERERIGRDLHDLLGHTLSVITLKAELARKLVHRDPARAAQEIEEVERISRDALREVRSVVSGYRSAGLAAEMARARLALEAAGVKLEYLALPVELDPVQENVLCFALREAVTNVMRHARATECRIALEPVAGEDGEAIRLEVRDNGRGGLAPAGAPAGTGLSSMRDRVEGLGGHLERRVDRGTAIVVTLPKRRSGTDGRSVPAGEPAPGSLAAEGAG